MSAMLRGLLEKIIDYAGVFPPAELPMDRATEQYFRYKSGRESWIVDKFLCPASRLAELIPLIEGKKAVTVGVIGTGGKDYAAFQDGLEADAQAMTLFEGIGEILDYEVRLPGGASVERVCNDLRAFDKVEVFLELPWGDLQSEHLAELAEQEWLGAKARMGGLVASAFPSSNSQARFLKECQDLDLSFKLTAGLHHPVPTFDRAMGVTMPGFANVLAAIALNDAHDLSTTEMAAVLESEEVVWTEGAVECNGLSATEFEASDVRTLFCGFGSCSVEEPLEGLAKLGLWGEVKA